MTIPRRPLSSLGGLTNKQFEALRAFRSLQRRNSIRPGLGELALELGLTVSGVREYVRRLLAAEYLKPTESRYRPWELSEKGDELVVKVEAREAARRREKAKRDAAEKGRGA
jgi:DNA-binding MarR family transcriptional regulator